MSEKAPQLNPEDKLTVTRATDDSLRYFKYDDNGKKQRIKNVDHDAILDHYGYSARSIEDVAAPIDVASTNEASVSTDDVAAPMASTDINPSAAYNQAVAEAEALRGGHMKNMASEKLRADIWEGRMKEAAPLFEIVMPAREKQAKDPNYHFTAEEAEAVGQLEEINLQGKASPKHKLEPITEDDYRYYKAGQEATSEEASTTESTTNNTWDAPDPSTANKDIPAPTDKPLPVHEPHPPVPVGEKPLELPKLPRTAEEDDERETEGTVSIINDAIESIVKLDRSAYKSDWAYDQDSDKLLDDLYNNIDKLGLGGTKRHDLIKSIKERIANERDALWNKDASNDKANIGSLNTKLPDEETGEITNQQFLANQEKLRQLKVAEAQAKAELKQAEQVEARFKPTESGDYGPVMHGGRERDQSVDRNSRAYRFGRFVGKAMNWLKESTEIVVEKPQSMFADDGEGLPVDVAHPPIPTPEGGFAENPNNNPSEGLTKTERENDALVLKSREMTKRALNKIEDPGKRKSAEQSLKLFQDMTSSIESELGGYQGTKDSFDKDFNGLRAQAKRKVLVDRINKALLLTTEKNELFAKVDAVIPEDKDFVYNPPRPRSAQTEQASSDLGEATEGQAEVIDIIKPNLDGVGDAIASLEASGEPEQANDEYIATVRQLENLYGDNPELMDQQIALFQEIVNTKRSPSQRIEQPKVANNEPSEPVGDSGGSRRQQVIAKLNEAS